MPNPTAANHKILLIEDDEQLQQSYQKLFTAEGFQVFQGYTGDQGIQLAKQERPDIILLDIMLKGGVNGFDVLERLKKDRDLFNIPVLMLTNLDSERKLALSIGAVDYLVKANTSIDLLLEKVKNYIGQSLTTFAEDTSQFGEATPAASTPPMTTPTPVTSTASVTSPVAVPPTTGAAAPTPPAPASATAVPPTPPVSPVSPTPSTPPAITTSASSDTETPSMPTPTPPAATPPTASPTSPTAVPPMTSEGAQPAPTSVPQPLPDKSPMTL